MLRVVGGRRKKTQKKKDVEFEFQIFLKTQASKQPWPSYSWF
jgi:hypothetical protein